MQLFDMYLHSRVVFERAFGQFVAFCILLVHLAVCRAFVVKLNVSLM